MNFFFLSAIAAAKISNPTLTYKAHQSQQQESHNEKVHIITRVGNDAFANLLLQNFDQCHVTYDPSSITSQDAHTGVAPIIVDQKTGDNMIVVVPGKIACIDDYRRLQPKKCTKQ